MRYLLCCMFDVDENTLTFEVLDVYNFFGFGRVFTFVQGRPPCGCLSIECVGVCAARNQRPSRSI